MPLPFALGSFDFAEVDMKLSWKESSVGNFNEFVSISFLEDFLDFSVFPEDGWNPGGFGPICWGF